jgi:preprotein translocase subunit YajC
MANSSVQITPDLVFNLFSAVLDIFALFVCVILLSVIIYRLFRIPRRRRLEKFDVPLIVSIDIICCIFIKSTLQIVYITVPTIKKDFQYDIEFTETSPCRYHTYILISITTALFWGYTFLAFFSFSRVIYPMKLWLHRPSLYLYVLIPGQFIFAFTSLLPLLFIFDSLHQILNEHYCAIPVIPFGPYIYASTIEFVIPIQAMCVFYFMIGRKIRQTAGVRQNQHFNRRDTIVMRRMVLNAIILNILSTPYVVLLIIDLIQNHFGTILYRTYCILFSAVSCSHSLMLPLVSTRLHAFLRPNIVVPAN